jgi:hypothetical protein
LRSLHLRATLKQSAQVNHHTCVCGNYTAAADKRALGSHARLNQSFSSVLPSEKECDIGVMVVSLSRGHLIATRVMVDFSAEPSRGLPALSKAS